jgi:hypothetical protein
MKPAKNVTDLAATLKAAASTPLVPPQAVQPTTQSIAPAPVATRRAGTDRNGAIASTQQITLRPKTELWSRYVNAAAERSKQAGRTVTAQEVALEIMEKAAL